MDPNTPSLKMVLTYEQCVADGVEEAPLAIMQFAAYKRSVPFRYSEMPPRMLREYKTLSVAASRARAALTPEWQNYYFLRQRLREMGGDPNTVAAPSGRAQAGAFIEHETPEARRERLLSMDLQRCKRPSAHRRGDRSTEAQAERDRLWSDYHEARVLQREREQADKVTAKEQAKHLKHMERELARHGSGVAHHPEVVGLRNEVVSARGRARRAKAWSARVLEDLTTCFDLGRPAPRCLLHRRIDLPLHLRPHHPSSD